MAGLTSGGYTPRTAGEWFDFARASFTQMCADLGVPAPRYDRAEFTTAVLTVAAQMASEIDAAVAAIFDLHDPNQASGYVLQYLATVAGVSWSDGRKSRVTLTLSAWDRGSVIFSAGGVVATDGKTRWTLIEDVVVAAGDTGQGVFEAETVGPTLADAGTITQRVTGIAGWAAVTNEDPATPGAYAESAASIRNKIGKGQGGTGSRSELSIKAYLERLSGVQQARIVYNPDFSTKTVSGRTIPVNGVGVWLYPAELTVDVRQQALSILFAMLPGNVNRSLPTTTGSDGVRGEIEGGDKRPHYEGFWFMNTLDIRVRISVPTATGWEPGGTLTNTTSPAIETVRSLFADFSAGAAVRQQDVIGRVVLVPGIARVNVEFSTNGGSTWTTADLLPDAATFPRLDPTTAFPVTVQEV